MIKIPLVFPHIGRVRRTLFLFSLGILVLTTAHGAEAAVAPQDPINISGYVRVGDTENAANPGKEGITLEARDAADSVLGTAVTNRGGQYAFTQLSGATHVLLTVPDGYRRIGASDVQNIDPSAVGDVVLGDFTVSLLPTITLNGDAATSTNQNTDYVDPGAVATKDGVDLPVESNLATVLPNTQVPGTYIITYTATDPITLFAVSVTRTVTVVPVEGNQGSTTVNVYGTVRTDAGAARLLTTPNLVSIELRDPSGVYVGSTNLGKGGTYSFSVFPLHYTACVIIPGGYGVINGPACQDVQFPNGTDVTLADFTLSTLPTITRKGDATLDVAFGAAYTDAGATAEKDGRDLTEAIKVTGLPNTSVSGLYVITYTVSDPLTSLSATTTRVVTVKPAPSTSHAIGGYIGGYTGGGSGSMPQTPATSTVSTSTATTTVIGGTEASSTEKKLFRETLRKRAMGAVLGAETASTNTPTSTVSTSTSGPEAPSQGHWGWLKALLALLAFALAIFGLWWWKKKPTIS